MKLEIQSAADGGGLQLAGDLDIYGVESLREALLARFGDADEIVLDLGRVENCDTAGLQLLLAARRKAVEGARALHFRNVSAAICTCGERLGLPASL
jgi:anti-anti-sigma factor